MTTTDQVVPKKDTLLQSLKLKLDIAEKFIKAKAFTPECLDRMRLKITEYKKAIQDVEKVVTNEDLSKQESTVI